MADTLATEVVATHRGLCLQLVFTDLVDFDRDVFLRMVTISTFRDYPREIRLFFHYDFRFWDVRRSDTIQHEPFDNVLIAYKDDCYFLLNASLGETVGITDWTTGSRDQHGEGGSWADAEDGVLSRERISFGAVDGVLAVHQPSLAPGENSVIYTWLAAEKTLQDIRGLDNMVSNRTPRRFITRTINYWRAWVNKEDVDFYDLPSEVVRLYRQSLLIIHTHVDNRGGIIAATDTDHLAVAHGLETYSSVWPRDGSYIANALDQAGYGYLAVNFYGFCKDVIDIRGNPHQEVLRDSHAYMLHKYTVDRLPTSNWIPLEDDEGE
jgi:GH15 family glucan-1,4-alpha-glucosidase